MSGSTEEFLTRVGNRVNGDAQTLADATDEAYRDNPLQALVDLRSEGEPGTPGTRREHVTPPPEVVQWINNEYGQDIVQLVASKAASARKAESYAEALREQALAHARRTDELRDLESMTSGNTQNMLNVLTQNARKQTYISETLASLVAQAQTQSQPEPAVRPSRHSNAFPLFRFNNATLQILQDITIDYNKGNLHGQLQDWLRRCNIPGLNQITAALNHMALVYGNEFYKRACTLLRADIEDDHSLVEPDNPSAHTIYDEIGMIHLSLQGVMRLEKIYENLLKEVDSRTGRLKYPLQSGYDTRNPSRSLMVSKENHEAISTTVAPVIAVTLDSTEGSATGVIPQGLLDAVEHCRSGTPRDGLLAYILIQAAETDHPKSSNFNRLLKQLILKEAMRFDFAVCTPSAFINCLLNMVRDAKLRCPSFDAKGLREDLPELVLLSFSIAFGQVSEPPSSWTSTDKNFYRLMFKILEQLGNQEDYRTTLALDEHDKSIARLLDSDSLNAMAHGCMIAESSCYVQQKPPPSKLTIDFVLTIHRRDLHNAHSTTVEQEVKEQPKTEETAQVGDLKTSDIDATGGNNSPSYYEERVFKTGRPAQRGKFSKGLPITRPSRPWVGNPGGPRGAKLSNFEAQKDVRFGGDSSRQSPARSIPPRFQELISELTEVCKKSHPASKVDSMSQKEIRDLVTYMNKTVFQAKVQLRRLLLNMSDALGAEQVDQANQVLDDVEELEAQVGERLLPLVQELYSCDAFDEQLSAYQLGDCFLRALEAPDLHFQQGREDP